MGDTELSKWKWVRCLGRGSLFEVHQLVDAQGGNRILKRPLHGSSAARALARERSVLRAAAAAAVTSASAQPPILPTWLGGGVDRRGPFGVQSVAPGQPLRARLEGNSPLSAERWWSVARPLVAALARLHDLRDGNGPLRVVHGDLSPDNVFLDDDTATVTFIDLAAAVWRDEPTPLFASARGTLPYVAPEIARSETEPDAMGDVYASAAILFGLAVGSMTDATADASLLLEVGGRGLRLERLAARRDLPAECRSALAAALQFNRAARTVRTARELSNLVEQTWRASGRL